MGSLGTIPENHARTVGKKLLAAWPRRPARLRTAQARCGSAPQREELAANLAKSGGLARVKRRCFAP